MTSVKEQNMIMKSCHSDPTSGHFEVTKTWKRIAERFYWKGLYRSVASLVGAFIIILHSCRIINYCVGWTLSCLPINEQKDRSNEA